LALALALLSPIASPTPAWTAPPPTQGVHLKPIGNPTWQPVDFHLFSAPIGTGETGFAELFATLQTLMPSPNHQLHPQLGIGPGAPHPPPYDAELAAGVAGAGFHEGVRFSQTEFTEGQGVILAWMNVPAPGTTGSSPDFAAGPIIPNSLFPIQVTVISIHNGKEFGPFTATVPPLDSSLDPPFAVDGHSHFPFFNADSAEFYPGEKLNGNYKYEIEMLDQSGNGWQIKTNLVVAP
jgi:hypothetical protein